MKKIALLSFVFVLLSTGCSPVKQISKQYKLDEFSAKRYVQKSGTESILVSMPQAAAGYQTEQMLYVSKPYELSPFAHSAWTDPPANMLFPLLFQSLQYSNYFRAVSSTPYAEETEYRLDSQLIELQQNFLLKPSVVQMHVKVVLSDLKANRVLGSRIFQCQIPAPRNNPFGGVVASNLATKKLTGDITQYVIATIQKNHHAPDGRMYIK